MQREHPQTHALRTLVKNKNTNIPIAYGGSIDASNVESIVKTQHVDGLLIGGASLKAAEFSEIAKISLNF